MAPQLCLILLYSEAENALGYWEIFSFWECNVDWHDITHDDDGTNILYSSTQKVNEKNSFSFSKNNFNEKWMKHVLLRIQSHGWKLQCIHLVLVFMKNIIYYM